MPINYNEIKGLTKKCQISPFLYFWQELFSNMFSVIIWKQNFDTLNRTGAIASLPPIGPFFIHKKVKKMENMNY